MSEIHAGRVPAYWATDPSGKRLPFILSLRAVDSAGKDHLVPSVLACIDRTVDATGREGLIFVAVAEHPSLAAKVARWVAQALALPGAFVLFQCEGASCLQRLMICLESSYEISLIHDADRPLEGGRTPQR